MALTFEIIFISIFIFQVSSDGRVTLWTLSKNELQARTGLVRKSLVKKRAAGTNSQALKQSILDLKGGAMTKLMAL
jgi:hypothetical protein